jgi:hypothetical protein
MNPASQPSPMPPHLRRLIGTCLVLMAAGSALGIALPAGLGWDFANFYDTGRRVMAGEYQNLYNEFAPIDGRAPQGNMRFYGVPLSAFFYVPLAWFGPETASRWFKFQSFLALAIGLWFLYVHLRQFVTDTDEGRWRFAAWFAIAALVYQPFWTIYRVGGQTTPTVFMLLVAALLTFTQARVWSTAFLLTLVILIKPAFVLLAGLMALAAGWPLCVALAVFGLGSAALSIALAGYPAHVEFWDLMITSSRTSVSWVYNSAATVAIENFRLLHDPKPVNARPAHLSRYVEGMRLVAGILFFVTVWGIYRVNRASRRESARLCIYLAAIVFGLALMPIVWEHYLSVLFLPLMYTLAVHDRLPSVARTLNVLALGLASIQSLIIFQWLHDHWQITSPLEALAAGLLKGGPLLISIGIWTRYNGDLCRQLQRHGNGLHNGESVRTCQN